MGIGEWLFICALLVIAAGLWEKRRRGTATVIDKRGTPQQRIDAARKAAAEAEQARRDRSA